MQPTYIASLFSKSNASVLTCTHLPRLICKINAPWGVVFSLDRYPDSCKFLFFFFDQRAIMDFNGNLLTRCRKTYLRAFLSWIVGMLNNQGLQYLRWGDEQIVMANPVWLLDWTRVTWSFRRSQWILGAFLLLMSVRTASISIWAWQ